MCLGGGPQQPQVQFVGPSSGDTAAMQASIDAYKSQMAQQSEIFNTQLEQQIASANQQTEELKAKYDMEASAAAAAEAGQQTGAYAAAATQSEAPSTAQTTAATPKKEKPKRNMLISTAGTASSAGTGLNIGV